MNHASSVVHSSVPSAASGRDSLVFTCIRDGGAYVANLLEFQKRRLDPSTSAAALKQVSPPLLAAKLGTSLYTPPLKHIGFVFRRGVHVHVLTFVDDRLLSKRKKSNFAGWRLPKTATCLISTAEPAE